MAKLFNRKNPNELTERQQEFRINLIIGAMWTGLGIAVAAVATPLIIYSNHEFNIQQERERIKTERVWGAGITSIEIENGITKLKIDAVPSYERGLDVLYIGRARYVDELGRRCVAPIIGENSNDLIPEDGVPFPDISIVIKEEVCSS